MANALTKSQIVTSVAEAVSLANKQAVQTLEALVALACKNAKNSSTIPGLGKIVLVNRRARIGRNLATGEQTQVKVGSEWHFNAMGLGAGVENDMNNTT